MGSRHAALAPFDEETGALNVVVETPKGHRNKFKFDERLELFTLTKVLPSGAVFPFDFGYVPATKGEDGDPLDVLLLMDEPVFVGCLVAARLVGVIEAEQTEDGETKRNDRLLAVAVESKDHAHIASIDDLSDHLVDEIEHFFVSYHEMAGHVFKPIGRHGPARAEKLVREGMKDDSRG
jgi:inorganic pyrophosphatase